MGMLVKRSRRGLENWKMRWFVIQNGVLEYYKVHRSVFGGCSSESSEDQVEIPEDSVLRGSFKLESCRMNLIYLPGRPYCILLHHSPVARLVIQAKTEEERFEWASWLYCAIRFATQGVSTAQLPGVGRVEVEYNQDGEVDVVTL